MQSPMLKSYISNCQNSPSVNLKQQKKDPINNIPKTGNDKNDTYIGSHVLKKTKKQKLIDLSCSVGLVALIGFYILKNDTSRARKLAKHIDFIPADTIEEAIKFGQKHLKIQEYNGFEKNDIDVINWINEGIVQVSNAHKGKIRVPKKINYTQLSSNTIAGVVTDKYDPLYGSFYVNKNYFEDIDIEVQMHRDYLRLIKNKIAFYKTIGISIDERDIKRIEEKIDSKSSGFKDKVEFIKTVSACSEITDILEERPYIAISQLLQEGKITSQDLGNQTIEDISKMDLKAQCQLLKKVVNIINSKTGSKCEFKPLKASPFKTIFHEMGHIQDMKPRVAAKQKFNSPDEYPVELKNWLDDFENMKVAYSVSEYCTSGPGEFIADVYAFMLAGNKLSNEIMELYTKLGGPKLPTV